MKKYGIFKLKNMPFNQFIRANDPMPDTFITVAHNLLFDTEDEAETVLMKLPIGAYIIVPVYVITSVKDFANPLQMSNEGS